jgi:hypothetical protein
MAVTKQARINPEGKIVPGDRRIHVSQDDGAGEADSIEFRYVGNPKTERWIDFSPYQNGSPLEPPNELTFKVPLGGVVRQVSRDVEPETYKYDVLDDATKEPTDDPDVIVD